MKKFWRKIRLLIKLARHGTPDEFASNAARKPD
jgi:hypothetical protein